MHEQYTWRAHYLDGTELDELGPDGVARPFAIIDLAQVAALEAVPQEPGLVAHTVRITEGMRPIWFRRRRVEVDLESGEQLGMSTITCLGYQATENGHNVQSFLFLFFDGSTLHTNDREAV